MTSQDNATQVFGSRGYAKDLQPPLFLNPMTSQTYCGVQIDCAWPATSLRPGAKRPDYERWKARLSSGERVAGWTLREIKALIKEAHAL